MKPKIRIAAAFGGAYLTYKKQVFRYLGRKG